MERRFTKMKVWVNGTFDVVHLGHIRLLEFAANFGTVRVGVDSDIRVKEKKGIDRPFNCLEDRIDFLKSIKFVDSVVSFDDDSELRNEIMLWDSEIIVIGDDYKCGNVIGSDLVKEIMFFEKIPNKSTTLILNEKDTRHR